MIKMKHENSALEILVSRSQIGNAERRGWRIVKPDEIRESETNTEITKNGKSKRNRRDR